MNAAPNIPEFRLLGVDGVLVRFGRVLWDDANARALAFRDRVDAARITGVTEVASSLVSVKVGFDPARTSRAQIIQSLKDLAATTDALDASPRRLWRIPAAFGPDHAPQLTQAAQMMGITPKDAVTQITNQTVRVLAIGFAPGQPYLGMLPRHWEIPRQTELTKRLPRGALICAVRQLIIWAADAPTGWRHVGQTAFRVYRPEQNDPFAFQPGDAVQFTAVSDSEFAAIAADDTRNGGAICEILR